MAAKTAAAAVRAYLDSLQQAVACVTNEVLGVGKDGYQPALQPHRLAFRTGVAARLAGASPLMLWVEQHYHIRPLDGQRLWKVETAAYYYALDDADNREIIAYHWHPHVAGAAFPHLHLSYGLVRSEILSHGGLSSASNGLRPDLAAAHLPTRRIALEDLLRLGIEQLGVEPRRAHRRNWDTMLRESRALFQVDRTWL